MREESLGSVGKKDQAEGQSRLNTALHLLMSVYDSSNYKTILTLLGLGDEG